MNAVSALPISSAPEVSRVALADLKVDCCFRESGVSKEHVELLAELDGRWPPVLVRRADRLGGRRHPPRHGCSIAGAAVDRGRVVRRRPRRRVARIRSPECEPRLAAHVAGAQARRIPPVVHAPGLVGSAARRTLRDLAEDGGELRTMAGGRPNGQTPHSDSGSRVGRDDRARPVNRAAMRLRVVEAIKAQPGASLRSVAAVAGVSPETVRLVRMSMRAVPDDESSPDAVKGTWGRRLQSRRSGGATPRWCRTTKATSSPGSTRRRSPSRSVRLGPQTLPLGRVYEIADEARRRSELWMRFARCVEARAKKRR